MMQGTPHNAPVTEVKVRPVDFDRTRSVFGPDQLSAIRQRLAEEWRFVEGRTVWNINSTARGGGVAEMLQPILAYTNGLGMDVRWLVIGGEQRFFEITKRIHNNLHDSIGDDGPLGEDERRYYEGWLVDQAEQCARFVKPGDFVICHDPQTAGLLPRLAKAGVHLVWRCHIGHDHPDELVQRAWRFLLPFLESAHAFVFSRAAYVPEALDDDRCTIIQPSIDPLSAKNQLLTTTAVRSILVKAGIIEGPATGLPSFLREDGSPAVVERCADMIHLGRPPAPDRRLVVQVSRWDSLKDPLGVLEGFARYLGDGPASLVLAGPNVSAVADDPEGGRVLDEVEAAWRALPHEVRKHVHIACLPMEDREENAAIVNALQRHAAIVVQKSLYEGFGLTVTEAMWKGRPIVASAVGGIQDQIVDGMHGLLVEDPRDLKAYATAVRRLLDDHELAKRLGENAYRRAHADFLFVRHLLEYAELFKGLKSTSPRTAKPISGSGRRREVG